MADSSQSGFLQWTIILVLTALLLATIVLAQVVATYSSAYIAAPKEIATFIDTVDFSIQENESHDRDVSKVQRLDDKLRLGRLLREIQKGGDDLREELNSLVIAEGSTTMHTSARLLWASRRTQIEDRVRRLDLLRMRFLVVYMGIITSVADKQPPAPPPLPPMPRDPEKSPMPRAPPHKPGIKKANTMGPPPVKRGPPPRRLTTQAVGHNESTGRPQRNGWAGVVHELQTSLLMHNRRTSVEQSMDTEKSTTP